MTSYRITRLERAVRAKDNAEWLSKVASGKVYKAEINHQIAEEEQAKAIEQFPSPNACASIARVELSNALKKAMRTEKSLVRAYENHQQAERDLEIAERDLNQARKVLERAIERNDKEPVAMLTDNQATA